MKEESLCKDFYPFMKVFLDGEFGVVTEQFHEWSGTYFVNGVEHQGTPAKLYGIIRWDTDKDTDFEDWAGLYGTFLDAGGIEVDKEHKFQFINEDGTSKKS